MKAIEFGRKTSVRQVRQQELGKNKRDHLTLNSNLNTEQKCDEK